MGLASLLSLDHFNDNPSMNIRGSSIWWLRVSTFMIAAAAAASAAYWMLKWSAATATPPSAPVVFSMPQPDPQGVARLLGGGGNATVGAASDPASRFKLTGVVANASHGGYALISIDGKPSRNYRVGAAVDDKLLLQSVTPRSAALATSADAPVSLTLELPRLKP